MLVAVLLAAGGYALWYSDALDKALSMGAEQDASVNSALVEPESGKPFYMLLLGSDSREGSGTSSSAAMQGDNERSDVMILARIDAANRLVTLVSIPRDTPYRLEDGSLVKINEAYNVGGASASIEAVSELTRVPISHYAEVHFSEFQQVVDKLGGVTVDVPMELSYKDALTGEIVTIPSGVQTLDGQRAQIFVRARHEYGLDQDAHRQDNVRALTMAIIDKLFDRSIASLPGTVLDLATCVGTDMSTSDLVGLSLAFAGGAGEMTVYSGTGPTDGDINEEANGAWLCYDDPEGWSRLMAAVEAGENPLEASPSETAGVSGE